MNLRLLTLGLGIAIGYVVGARAGRERYDQMKSKATELWESPRVTRARTSVEEYARTQGPILLDKAEAVAQATPGFVASAAKDVAKTTREVAESARGTAKEFAETATASAKDFAETAMGSAKDFADRASTSAQDVVGRVTHTAGGVRDNATKTSAELRERGESAIDRAFTTVGKARDEALAPLDDDENEDEDDVTTSQK
jgi:hypothetical protein